MVSSESSFINHGNAILVTEQIEKALEKGRRSIGIVTPYKKQANLINEKLLRLKTLYPDADLQAGTIHTFQGKEKEIIIYDITFSPTENSNYLPATYSGDVDSSTAKLLNIAMTRAEEFFIIVGDIDGILVHVPEDQVLHQWVKEISKK
jgi:superfamily I DNA and/or RNA helicase